MKIISGSLRNRKIFTLEKSNIRPTTGRSKEAIFSILYSSLPGNLSDYKLLDLCAGTGSFGFEAISRGYKYCVFVDNSNESLRVLNYNINNLQILDQCKIIRADAANLQLSQYYPGYIPDIIFIDPPYFNSPKIIDQALNNLLQQKLISADTIVICETKSTNDLNINNLLEIYDERRYGNSKISFIRLADD